MRVTLKPLADHPVNGTIVLLLLCFMPLAGHGQNLSEAERSAEAQAPMTETQREMWLAGCALPGPAQDEMVEVAPGIAGPRLSLPSFQILIFMIMALDNPESGTFSLSTFPDLPNGGVAGKDICGPVQIHLAREPENAGDAMRLIGFWLRDGIDLATDYPNTSKEIFARNQSRGAPAGTYVILDRSQPAVSDWYDRHGAAWLIETGSGVAFVRSQWLLLPIADD